MSGSTALIVVLALMVAGWMGLRVYRHAGTRPASRSRMSEHGNDAEQWGVRVSALAAKQACPQVRKLLGKEFLINQKPRLPLPDCPYPRQCECRYTKLYDRRRVERRSSEERRKDQRFEKDNPPRRSGRDRRRGQVDWS